MQGATRTYTATEARKNFADILDEAYFGTRVVVTKRDRKVALISLSLLEEIEKVLEREAALEAEDARKALSEFQSMGGKTMSEIKQELGMD